MDTQTWLVLVVSLVGGAAGAAIINVGYGMKKQKQDRVDEHSRWLRDKKQEIMSRFLAQTEATCSNFRDLFWSSAELDETDLDKEVSLYSQLQIVAPADLAKQAEQMLGSLILARTLIQVRDPAKKDEFYQAMSAFREAQDEYVRMVRSDLGAV